jgi:Spy/CpxP family protein refolding chaperone
MNKLIATLLFAAALALPSLADAQPGKSSEISKKWKKTVYPAQLIMQHQDAIKLTAMQRSAIMKELKAAQVEILDLQFALFEKSNRALDFCKKSKIDDSRALKAASEAMALEQRLKVRYMQTNIRLKNILSLKQQKRLDQLRKSAE